MRIISHRGYWKNPLEKNTLMAIANSFELGIGTETDFRDRGGKLVVSHDLATHDSVDAAEVIEAFAIADQPGSLAINIKADGLQSLLSSLLGRFSVKNYFLFDMSIPDAIQSLRSGLNCFCRQSEFEVTPNLYNESVGVWLDSFGPQWFDEKVVSGHLLAGKKVCLVSPELHGRSPEALWDQLEVWSCRTDENLFLCTDRVDSAISKFKDTIN